MFVEAYLHASNKETVQRDELLLSISYGDTFKDKLAQIRIHGTRSGPDTLGGQLAAELRTLGSILKALSNEPGSVHWARQDFTAVAG